MNDGRPPPVPDPLELHAVNVHSAPFISLLKQAGLIEEQIGISQSSVAESKAGKPSSRP